MGITYNKMLISVLAKCNLTPIFFSVKINTTYKVGDTLLRFRVRTMRMEIRRKVCFRQSVDECICR